MSDQDTTGWHAAPDDLRAYREGHVQGAAADSVEAHLLRCAACRAALADTVPPAEQAARFERLADALDQPSRWSRRSPWLRLAAGTPELATAAISLAVAFVVVPLAAAALDPRPATAWFLALAPALPVAGTVLAYRAVADPVGALAEATPLHSFRIVLMRVAVLLGALLPAGILASVLMPGRAVLLLGWVLPALAGSALVLAVGTRWDPVWLATALCGAWAVTVAVGMDRSRLEPLAAALDGLVVNTVTVQATALAVGGLALLHLSRHRDELTYGSPT
jgi:hypothetical protein